jgi:hypothetical protein
MGGYTYEEEQEAIARTMQNALIYNAGPPPEVNPTVEQQNQQVADTMAAALRTNNAELYAQDQEQRGLLEMLGTTQQYGAGPPYTASPQEYVGPPPMEAGADWDYSSGYPSNWHDFNSNNYSTGGGFFNFEELFQKQGKRAPQAFQSGSNLPSTNNYRLLPPEYRDPRYIMRNGQIIDMNSNNMAGPFGPDSMGVNNPSWGSGAVAGSPVAWSPGPYGPNKIGWPGAFGFSMNSTGGS